MSGNVGRYVYGLEPNIDLGHWPAGIGGDVDEVVFFNLWY